jgi:CheY-like chemotaxis protein
MASPLLLEGRMRKSLLVIDDDAVFRQYVKNAVVPLNLEFLGAERGLEGSQFVHERNPDLIIVDGLLPDTDGVTWIRQYRKDGGKAPMLFASAFYRDMATYRRLTHELAVEVVRKPIEKAELVVTLSRLLGIDHRPATLGFGTASRWMAWDDGETEDSRLAAGLLRPVAALRR